MTGCDPRPYPLPASEWLGYGRREAYWRTHPATPDKRRMCVGQTPDAAGAASAARISHLRATLGGSTCLRDARPQWFCRLRTETAGTREKSKSLPHNKFMHVNAPAASGIPAAPYLGMTCQHYSHAKHGWVLNLTPARHFQEAGHTPETHLRDYTTPPSAQDSDRKAPLIEAGIAARIGSGKDD